MSADSLPIVFAIVLISALLLFGCVTQPQQQGRENKMNQLNQTVTLAVTLVPPSASLRPHATTPSPYPTAFPSVSPTPFLECAKDSDCIVSGCNNEICAKQSYSSVCIARPEFECLKLTSCGCSNGRCGWKQNDAYAACLKTKTS